MGGFNITILLEIDVSYQGSLILYYNYLTVIYFKQLRQARSVFLIQIVLQQLEWRRGLISRGLIVSLCYPAVKLEINARELCRQCTIPDCSYPSGYYRTQDVLSKIISRFFGRIFHACSEQNWAAECQSSVQQNAVSKLEFRKNVVGCQQVLCLLAWQKYSSSEFSSLLPNQTHKYWSL